MFELTMITDHLVTPDNVALATTSCGDGDPVIFLHAAVADSRMWRAQLEGLSETRHAIAFDRRGFGRTAGSPGDYSSLADLATIVDAKANGTPAALVGCSQGRRIALDFTLRYPDRVSTLILIAPNVSGSPAPSYPPEVAALMAEIGDAEKEGNGDRVNALKARAILDGVLAREGRVTGPARATFLEMNGIVLSRPAMGADRDDEDAYNHLEEIAVRSLVIWGDLDFPHVQERSRYVAENLPNASHTIIPNAAHLPSLERPNQVTGILKDFLDN